MSGSHFLWAICGGKGGAGKTFITANIALYLAGLGRKTAVCDADIKGPSLHTALGLRDKADPLPLVFSVSSIADSNSPELTPYENLSLLQRRINGAQNHAKSRFDLAGESLRRQKYDFVLVDVEAGIRPEMTDMLFGSGRGAIVITPEPSCLERCYLFIRQAVYQGLRKLAEKPLYAGYVEETFAGGQSFNLIRLTRQAIGKIAVKDPARARKMEARLGSFSLGVILNMSRRPGDEDIGKMFCQTVSSFYGPRTVFLGCVPFDERVLLAERSGKAFIREYGSSDAAACLAEAGRNLMEEMIRAPGAPSVWRDIAALDYYAFMRIPRNASLQDIQSARARLTAHYSEGSIASYGAISPSDRKEALELLERGYAALSDFAKRRDYDISLAEAASKSKGEGSISLARAPRAEGADDSSALASEPPASSCSAFPGDRISGSNLRDIRISKKTSLEEISAETKIRVQYLEALENETPGSFPAPVVAKGFLKCYAKALGLDPAEVAKRYCLAAGEEA